jgi:hypothetical protein
MSHTRGCVYVFSTMVILLINCIEYFSRIVIKYFVKYCRNITLNVNLHKIPVDQLISC